MRLGSQDIEKIEGAITSSLGLFSAVANQFEPGDEPPIDRVTKLLAENKILLVIDNLETILDESIRKFATDIPGESKLVFTSRVPLGSDLSVHVGDFSETEARNYLRRLGETYYVPSIKGASNEKLDRYARQLGKKPLLLKWFCLGVASGLSPEAITSKVDIAIKFCLENVINQLTPIAKKIACVLAVLPSSASAPLIHEIADLSSAEVEIGVAELVRFALVQRQEKSKFEVSYQLGGFSKTHIVRVLQPTTTFSEDALKKFRSVEGAFQNERRAQNANRYSFRYVAVRNRTEMLVSKKLKKIAEEANEGDIATAEELLQEVKSLSSGYFEVHRMDAFVAIKAQEVARAKASYQTAIELAEKQPQLHYFYAGMLSRYMSDFDAAADQLKTALDLDPNAPCVLQELARVACFRYDFPTAHYALEKMQNLPFRSNRDKIIHADLCTQVHYREADHLVMNGNISGASRPLRLLSDTISRMDSRLFDEKHVEHLYKALILVSKLKREIAFEDGDLLCELEDKIQAIKPLTQQAK
ncbi:MAG: hypothetical protein PHW63_00970 [Alphaproteobacteria bacterium]|nr:hypothetical protein [Alphaproteobacteria bacterium]